MDVSVYKVGPETSSVGQGGPIDFLKGSTEVQRVMVLQGQTLDQVVSLSQGEDLLLVVLKGQVAVALQGARESQVLEVADAVVVESSEGLHRIRALEDTLLLTVKALCQGLPSAEADQVQEALASIEKQALEKKIAYAIMTHQPILEHETRELYHILIQSVPFQGDYEHRLQETFYNILAAIPLSPMKLSPMYCASLCREWVLNEADQEEAFGSVMDFLGQVYHQIMLPEYQEPIIRKVVYWTLVPVSEIKTAQFLSEKLFMNRTYLSGKFKGITGYSLSEYLTHVKMFGAMLLLLDSKLSLNDVLDILGYKDEGHFNKNFKKYVGLTPQAYVKQFRAYNHAKIKMSTKLTNFGQ